MAKKAYYSHRGLVLIILLRPNGLVPRRYGPAWLMARLGWR